MVVGIMLESNKDWLRADMSKPYHLLTTISKWHILQMKTEELFSMINGVYTKDLKGVVLEYVLSQIHAANIPQCQVEYLLDHLFLSWISFEKTMIIEMLNTTTHLFQSQVGDNNDTKA